MLQNKDFVQYVKTTCLEEVQKQLLLIENQQQDFISLSISIDLAKLIKTQTQLASSIISNFPCFMKSFQQGCQQILEQKKMTPPTNGYKINLDIRNCILPKHDIKSFEFLNASIRQSEGILLYLKEVQVLQIHQLELYLQSWTQIWQPQCSCPKTNRIQLRRRQSLVQILKNSDKIQKKTPLKQQCQVCSQCFIKMKLQQLKQDDFTFLSCRRLSLNINYYHTFQKSEIFSNNFIDVYVENKAINKYKVGDIVDMCCYYKTNVDYQKLFSKKMPLIHNFYLICSYPQEDYLKATNSLFLGNLINLQLKETAVLRINDMQSILYNYKGLIELINKIKFPYLQENTLSSLKLVTINSIFCHQILKQRLNMLILTDEPNLIQTSITINNLNIKKLPSIYDERTILTFLHNCHNCILLVANPDKKDFFIINKLLKGQIMENLNLTIWVIAEPQETFKKKNQIQNFDIILDLTMQKNLNVCPNVYQNLIDKLLNSFLMEDELNFQNILTIPKRKRNHLQNQEEQICKIQQGDSIKQQKIAKDILQRYFLKSRQYKTIKFNGIETITKLSQSFMNFRHFIKNKGKVKNGKKHLSILDAILTIFVDEETNRNKYSKSNTLFADDISKIMLNEADVDISIWQYQYQENYMQQTKKFIKRDEMVQRVLVKIFSLLYEGQLI